MNTTTEPGPSKAEETIDIDLRRPGLAAFLAWLWPGAGHIYQRRYSKGLLFMVCILGIYFFGLFLGEGRVVYASLKKEDRRWQYLCQIGVGLPALPALEQYRRVVREGQEPLWGGIMAPPKEVFPESEDELARWHRELGDQFDLGTLYTMIAGLLNVLAIYDAFAGPFVASSGKDEDAHKDKPPPKNPA